ncbi:hypothetical protein LAZ67_9002901 [Cordylochernes scorpioides]|uniref:Reverse transcriptase domain-containing protein n=1 Tax=Cordylochernes scorpioides TaxID=51811 RepID=A0ABY6KU45_9ARAC|nr:hypothetical protein LAZ67_9002901 [Cordylochernes scorpioides]
MEGCAVSAALFSIATRPLLRRLESTLGVGNVIAYADDIVLLFHRDEEFERVATVLEDFKRASGIAVNLRKSTGLWCGAPPARILRRDGIGGRCRRRRR